MDVSADGRRLVTCGGRTLSTWDAATGERIATGEHPGAVNELWYSGDGDTVVSTGRPDTTILWNASNLSVIRTLPHPSIAWSARFAAGDSAVVTGCYDGSVRLWDARDGGLSAILREPSEPYVGVVAAARTRTLVAALAGPNVFIWDVGASGGAAAVARHSSDVRAAAFCPDDRRLITVASDFVGLWIL